MNQNHDGLKAEYDAVVSYHTAIVQSRFTIAGLYSAAFAVLSTLEFSTTASLLAKLGVAASGIWITICVWILELRGRSLYTAIAARGIEIERHYWGVDGPNYYKGFFSLQYKRPPAEGESAERIPSVPPEPDPVFVSMFFRLKPFRLSSPISLWITQSRGLDLLYFGGLSVWGVILAWRVWELWGSLKCD